MGYIWGVRMMLATISGLGITSWDCTFYRARFRIIVFKYCNLITFLMAHIIPSHPWIVQCVHHVPSIFLSNDICFKKLRWINSASVTHGEWKVFNRTVNGTPYTKLKISDNPNVRCSLNLDFNIWTRPASKRSAWAGGKDSRVRLTADSSVWSARASIGAWLDYIGRKSTIMDKISWG